MRPSRHTMYMAMARAAAMRATCYRLNVGAILIDRITRTPVSMGYNGAPSGEPHCTGDGCRYFSTVGCRVVHAERNALDRLPRRGIEIRSLSAYVTHSPCGACADQLIQSNLVSEVYFETPYRDPLPVQTLLLGKPDDGLMGIDVWQLLPSGLAVDMSTGRLVTPA